MDQEIASNGRSADRPVTRWRREQDSSDKSQTSSENSSARIMGSYGKMERPSSRRGFKTDVGEYGMSRPSTSGRNVLSRPPSAGLVNRGATAASRLSSISSASLTRSSSGILRNIVQPSAKIIDRPVTQQGLAGMPSGFSKNVPKLAKQIQDKRYYEQILQQKIRELNQEINTITLQVESQSGEHETHMDYDGSLNKGLNTELTKIQGQITEYCNLFDKLVSDANKKEIISEAKELKEFNDRQELELKNISQKRQLIESKLSAVNKEIDYRRNTAEKMLGNMNADMRSKFDELLGRRGDLQREINQLQKQQNQLTDEKCRMQEKIAYFPKKQEAYKIYFKIIESEKKRDELLEGQPKSWSSKGNNMDRNNLDVTSAKKQIIEIEKKIADAEQELQQLGTDTEETRLDKSVKNKDYDKDEIMDIFMTTLERSKAEELEKLGQLEDEIIEYLDHISNNMTENVDSSVLTANEMEILKSLIDQNSENRNEKSFEELKQDNNKLRQILNKLKSHKAKIKVDTSSYEDNSIVMYNETIKRDSKVYDISEGQLRQLTIGNGKSINRESRTSKFDFMDDYYSELKEKIKENEIYRPISILEDKLKRFTNVNEHNELDRDDRESLLEKLSSLTAQYNAFLIKEMKSAY